MENMQCYYKQLYEIWNIQLFFYSYFFFLAEMPVLLYCGLLIVLKTWVWIAVRSAAKFVLFWFLEV